MVSSRWRIARVTSVGLALVAIALDLDRRFTDQRAAVAQSARRQSATHFDASLTARALRALSDPVASGGWSFSDGESVPAPPTSSDSYREALTRLRARRAWRAARSVPEAGAPAFPVVAIDSERFLVLSHPGGRVVLPWVTSAPQLVEHQLFFKRAFTPQLSQ